MATEKNVRIFIQKSKEGEILSVLKAEDLDDEILNPFGDVEDEDVEEVEVTEDMVEEFPSALQVRFQKQRPNPRSRKGRGNAGKTVPEGKGAKSDTGKSSKEK